MKALSVLILRYKLPQAREWRVPLNITVAGTEIPIGLGLITLALFSLATINVLTKKVATISGMAFTIAFFITFEISERYNRKYGRPHTAELEKFRLAESSAISQQTVNVRPGNVIVTVRRPDHLNHLQRVLQRTDTKKIDIVVLAVHRLTSMASGEHPLETDQIFSSDETQLFTKVVALAEKAGKHVELVVVPSPDPILAAVQMAQNLQSSLIVTGPSARLDPPGQGRVVGQAWEKLPEPRPSLSLEIVMNEGRSVFFNLGPHPPRLWPEDVQTVHDLWLEMSEPQMAGSNLSHRDVISVALQRLKREFDSTQRNEVLADIRKEVKHRRRSKNIEQESA